jgi:hypothetical protein
MGEMDLRAQYELLLNAIGVAGRHMFSQVEEDGNEENVAEKRMLINEARWMLKTMTAFHWGRNRDRHYPTGTVAPDTEGQWEKCSDGSWAYNPPGCLNSSPKLPRGD